MLLSDPLSLTLLVDEVSSFFDCDEDWTTLDVDDIDDRAFDDSFEDDSLVLTLLDDDEDDFSFLALFTFLDRGLVILGLFMETLVCVIDNEAEALLDCLVA